MTDSLRRRQFLRTASALGLGTGLAGGATFQAINPARADDMVLGPDAVAFRPEIEPVVRWIEQVPRDRALEGAVAKLKEGLSYRDLLAGLFLAGIRNIKPRPVGFKFHAVMVMNSAHVLGQTAPVEDRLLPMLWALDNFKGSQAQDVKEGDWTLSKVDESRLPSPGQAKSAFIKAMDDWDADAADAAAAALCRSTGAAEAMEPFWRYGVRDQRNIGHKAIFTMQCWRTLQAIGWPHAEPVLRSLAFAMLDLQGDTNRAAAGPYEANQENAKKVRDGWQVGKANEGATRAMLATLRGASPEESSGEVVKHLNAGVAPAAIWDGIMLAASELLLRSPGIIALHAMTSANALHFIHGASGDDATRKLALLQAAGWLPMFRGRAQPRSDLAIDTLGGDSKPELADVFATAHGNRSEAAAKAVAYVRGGGSTDAFFATARRLIFHKGRDSHDYKYGAAAWEEVQLASEPKWQAPLTAATLAQLPDPESSDSPLMIRARAAVEQVAGKGS